MPFAGRSGYSFTPASIRQNAPPLGGVYGLSNARDWIYIRSVDDIRAALLDHLNERNPPSDFSSVAGFSFELCDPAERSLRCSRNIQELRPLSATVRKDCKRSHSLAVWSALRGEDDMDRLQVETVELDEQLWEKWIEKGKLREQARKRRWRIVSAVVGCALLPVICLLGWMWRS